MDNTRKYLAELIETLCAQSIAECLDFAQRLLQIVGSDAGEVLQLGVALLELSRKTLQALLGYVRRNRLRVCTLSRKVKSILI